MVRPRPQRGDLSPEVSASCRGRGVCGPMERAFDIRQMNSLALPQISSHDFGPARLPVDHSDLNDGLKVTVFAEQETALL